MTCRSLFDGASKQRKNFDAPIQIHSKCHPRSAVEVWIDCVHRTVILVCGKCDRTIEIIKVKGKKNG